MGKGCKDKPYFAREMAEEYAVNIEPYQFELMSSKSDGETILMMWTEGELVKLIGKSLFIHYSVHLNLYCQ